MSDDRWPAGPNHVGKLARLVSITSECWPAGSNYIGKLLLEMGKVDVDSKDECGRTPLLWASINTHKSVFLLLIEVGHADLKALMCINMGWLV